MRNFITVKDFLTDLEMQNIENCLIPENSELFTNADHHKNKNKKMHLWNYKSQKISRNFINEISKTLSAKGNNQLFEYCYYLCNSIFNRKRNQNIETPYCAIMSPLKELVKNLNKNDKNVDYKDFMDIIENNANKNCTFKNLKELAKLELITFDIKNIYSDYFVTVGMVGHKITSEHNRRFQKAEYAAIKNHSGYVMERQNNFDKIINNNNEPLSERDIILDLYLNSIYNDDAFELSVNCPLVMFDKNNFTTNYSYRYLAQRWNISLGKVHNVLNKFKKLGYIDFYSVPNHGTYIFMKAYSKFLWNVESIIPAYFSVIRNASPKNYISIYVNYFYALFKDLKNNKEKLSEIIRKYKLHKNKYVCYCDNNMSQYRSIAYFVKNFNAILRSTFYHEYFIEKARKAFVLERFKASLYREFCNYIY